MNFSARAERATQQVHQPDALKRRGTPRAQRAQVMHRTLGACLNERLRRRPHAAARWIEELFDAYRVFCRVGSAVEVLSVRHGSQLIHSGEVGGD